MNLTERINLLSDLKKSLKADNEKFINAINAAYLNNKWFAKNFIQKSANAISENYLEEQKLTEFVKKYDFTEPVNPKNVGLVLAGNIPFVGFHDFLMCFLSGNKAQIKLSSKDEILMKYVLQEMETINPSFKNYYEITERLQNMDAVIATGSNNSSRYFEYYFKQYKHIIRKNRNSIAVLSGNETKEELINLGNDIFNYFGLGCRSVSKLFVPENYDFPNLLKILEENYEFAAHHHKYRNNYDYQLAILLLNQTKHFISHNLILVESESMLSPISIVNYETYKDINEVVEKMEQQKEEIQCTVSNAFKNNLNLGEAQKPQLHDFADGIDTFKFMLEL